MDTQAPVQISAEITPNPHTLKFNVNRTLVVSGSLNYPDRETARGVLLAERLFVIKDVLGVMIGRSFVTVTKSPEGDWQPMIQPITDTLKSLLSSNEVLFPQSEGSGASAERTADPASGEIEKRIREILDNEIRPAVAMDGGDITFYGYDNGIVTLHLQGSCSSCPSSIMTLKMGVESRLKQSIPEVREVVQL